MNNLDELIRGHLEKKKVLKEMVIDSFASIKEEVKKQEIKSQFGDFDSALYDVLAELIAERKQSGIPSK